MFVGVVVFIPVVGLAGFHCGLVCMGRTTNEHVSSSYFITKINVYGVGRKVLYHFIMLWFVKFIGMRTLTFMYFESNFF